MPASEVFGFAPREGHRVLDLVESFVTVVVWEKRDGQADGGGGEVSRTVLGWR